MLSLFIILNFGRIWQCLRGCHKIRVRVIWRTLKMSFNLSHPPHYGLKIQIIVMQLNLDYPQPLKNLLVIHLSFLSYLLMGFQNSANNESQLPIHNNDMKIFIYRTMSVAWVKDPSRPILPKLLIINLRNLLYICMDILRNCTVSLGQGGHSIDDISMDNSPMKHGMYFSRWWCYFSMRINETSPRQHQDKGPKSILGRWMMHEHLLSFIIVLMVRP